MRDLATAYRASQFTYRHDEPATLQVITAGGVTLEPGKCVRCERCVHLGERVKPGRGPVLAYRGQSSRICPPAGSTYEETFRGFEDDFIGECPVGALVSTMQPKGEKGTKE